MTQDVPSSISELLSEADRKETGGVFLFLLRCLARKVEIDLAIRNAVAAHFSLPAVRVIDVEGFVREFLSRGGEGLGLCHGSSCRLNGGPAFHARIREVLDEAQLGIPFRGYHCLSNCLDGPNLAVGALLYSPKEEVVIQVPQRQLEMRNATQDDATGEAGAD